MPDGQANLRRKALYAVTKQLAWMFYFIDNVSTPRELFDNSNIFCFYPKCSATLYLRERGYDKLLRKYDTRPPHDVFNAVFHTGLLAQRANVEVWIQYWSCPTTSTTGSPLITAFRVQIRNFSDASLFLSWDLRRGAVVVNRYKINIENVRTLRN